MAISIYDDGFSVTGKHALLLASMDEIVRKSKGEVRDLLLGIQYDTWHAEFGEEMPDCILYHVRKAKEMYS